MRVPRDSGRRGWGADMMTYWMLDGTTVKRCPDLETWMLWMSRARRQVNRTVVGEVLVSTVFTGIDSGGLESSPRVFETMVFDPDRGRRGFRYCTWQEAVEGHKQACDEVRNG